MKLTKLDLKIRDINNELRGLEAVLRYTEKRMCRLLKKRDKLLAKWLAEKRGEDNENPAC